jgi:hypothetical protein
LLCEACDPQNPRPGVVRPTPLHTVVCGPCWAQHGGAAGAAEIGPAPLTAIPVRDPHSQVEWLRLLEAEPWVQRLRSDARRRLLQLARCLRNWAGWETFECRPTWPELCSASEWARSTMAAWLRQLRLYGWLTVVEPGSTPQHRPMGSPRTAEGNRAAVYGLRVPLRADEAARAQRATDPANAAQPGAETPGEPGAEVGTNAQLGGAGDETWTPSWSCFAFKEGFVGSSTRARDFFHSTRSPAPLGQQMEALRARSDQEKPGFFFSERVPASRAEMLAAACELRHQHPILARLSPRAVRSLARSYWRAGWHNDDVLHGLEYRPTSWSTLPSTAEYAVIHPLRWSQSRLAGWLDERGRVLPGKSRRAAEREARRRSIERRYGRVGERLLRRDSAKPLVDRVAAYGQQCARALAEEQTAARRRAELDQRYAPNPRELAASDQTRTAAMAEIRTAEQQRAAKRRGLEVTAAQRQIIEQAKAYVEDAKVADTPAPAIPAGAATVATEPPATPEERVQRALERAHLEGRTPKLFGRRRPRW